MKVATETGRGVPDDRPEAWVAEDDAEMLELIATQLRGRGFNVREFADGDSLASELWYFFHAGGPSAPDLVVTDVFMPGESSGLDVIAMLRRADWYVPIIVITAAPTSEIQDTAHRLGAVCVLEKPFDMRRLGVLASLCV